MRSLWSRFFHKSQAASPDIVAVAFSAEGLAIVHAIEHASGQREICSARFHPFSSEDRRRVLASQVETSRLHGVRSRMVLGGGQFRLLQIAFPDVPEEEAREALRWRIHDLIDFPADEAEIEYFPMPTSKQSHRETMVTVAVCRSLLIKELSQIAQDSGLEPEVIDIPELCLRNLAACFPEVERGVALLYVEHSRGLLLIQKGQELFVYRDVEIHGEALVDALADPGSNRSTQLIDHLALEIQRSLDYYESYYGMPPVASLVVAPLAQHTQALVDGLNQSLGVISRAMDVSAIVPCRERLDDATQQLCLPAIGAVLRNESRRT